MRKKATYMSPLSNCVEMGVQQELLLRASGDQQVVDIFDGEQAGENVGGLSRRRNVWEDEEPGLEEEEF